MRLRRGLIWIPLALGAAIVAASAPSQAQLVIEPAPMFVSSPMSASPMYER